MPSSVDSRKSRIDLPPIDDDLKRIRTQLGQMMGRAADSALAIVLTDNLISTRVASAKKRVLSDSSRVMRKKFVIQSPQTSTYSACTIYSLSLFRLAPCMLLPVVSCAPEGGSVLCSIFHLRER